MDALETKQVKLMFRYEMVDIPYGNKSEHVLREVSHGNSCGCGPSYFFQWMGRIEKRGNTDLLSHIPYIGHHLIRKKWVLQI